MESHELSAHGGISQNDVNNAEFDIEDEKGIRFITVLSVFRLLSTTLLLDFIFGWYYNILGWNVSFFLAVKISINFY